MAVCPACGVENREGAKFCNECAAPLAETAPTPALEERKVVSVLFCDLVGFTAASETADPEDVRARLRPRCAQDPPVVRERLSVPSAQTLEQLRRTLNVREEECNGSGRQVGHYRSKELHAAGEIVKGRSMVGRKRTGFGEGSSGSDGT